jgi:hypothetical protein
MKIVIDKSIKIQEDYSDNNQVVTTSKLAGQDSGLNDFVTKDICYRVLNVDDTNKSLIVPIDILSLFGVTAEEVSMIDISLAESNILTVNRNEVSFELKLTSTIEDEDESLSTSESISESGIVIQENKSIYITASSFSIGNIKEFYNEISIIKLNIPSRIDDVVCNLKIVLTKK